MASAHLIRLGWQDIITTLTTSTFKPATGWYSADGLSNAKVQMEVRALFGTGTEIVPGYQLCNDERNPDTAQVMLIENDGGATPGYAYANGFYDYNSSVTSLSTNDKAKIRFGYWLKVSSGTGGARVCCPRLAVTY